MARAVTERQRRRCKTVRLRMLACDPTHASQHLSLCNAFQDRYDYLPVLGCLSCDQ